MIKEKKGLGIYTTRQLRAMHKKSNKCISRVKRQLNKLDMIQKAMDEEISKELEKRGKLLNEEDLKRIEMLDGGDCFDDGESYDDIRELNEREEIENTQ